MGVEGVDSNMHSNVDTSHDGIHGHSTNKKTLLTDITNFLVQPPSIAKEEIPRTLVHRVSILYLYNIFFPSDF